MCNEHGSPGTRLKFMRGVFRFRMTVVEYEELSKQAPPYSVLAQGVCRTLFPGGGLIYSSPKTACPPAQRAERGRL